MFSPSSAEVLVEAVVPDHLELVEVAEAADLLAQEEEDVNINK